MSSVPSFDIVVPTVGRPSLATLLDALGAQDGPRPRRVFLGDDRTARTAPLMRELRPHLGGWLAACVRVVDQQSDCAGTHGPAAARNRGWRRSRADWIAFLDDDVVPPPGWLAQLGDDLASVDGAAHVGASSGRIVVPLPRGRRPTDWERDVAGLERAVWATADMAYRRAALEAVDGFDEGFTRAYREDADLGLRVTEAGFTIVQGARHIEHPVRPAGPWISLRRQAGNAADARMRLKHGSTWRTRAHVHRGRFPVHSATTMCALVAVGASLVQRRAVARVALAMWLAATAEFSWRRIVPGPRTLREVLAMITTSVCIPPAAVGHRLRGEVTERRRTRNSRRDIDVVLVDRDGTIVVDRPYNGSPEHVVPVAGARAALDRLRRRGIALGVVSNQSGVARGLLTRDQVEAVNARVESLLGPFGGWWYCPHDEAAGCDCRKPAPGLVHAALEHFGADAGRCVLVGDTAADVGAARAAGVRAILVPNEATRVEEIERTPEVAPTLAAAVHMVIGGDA